MFKNHIIPRRFLKMNYFSKNNLILGIETSCDDTGAAIVDLNGKLLSEHVNSQIKISANIGGIIPTVARQLHLTNINPTVMKVMKDCNASFKDLCAIALTVKPGLPLSLAIGRDYAVNKAKEYNLPIIPIHHMEAHALVVRMLDQGIKFPFMVLLISGGNSLLGLAHDVDTYSLFGTRCDISPGDCLDKIARLLHLIGDAGLYPNISGGRAIEIIANENTETLINFDSCRTTYRDCNFSFSGLEGAVYNFYKEHNEKGIMINMPQLCASILHTMAVQMCRRLYRAMIYCDRYIECPPRTLVVSGGVASNLLFRSCFERLCNEFEYQLECPPVKYCTDNGAMIAWNGYELYKLNKRVIYDVDTIDYSGRSSFGVDLRQCILEKQIKSSKLKFRDLFIK